MKNMKKRSLCRIFAGILGIGILLTGAAPCAAAAYGYDEYGDPIVTATPVPDGQAAAVTPAHSSYYSQAADTDSIDGWPKGPGIEAQAAVLMDVNTEAVLYSKNADTQLYPASITKIMTLLLIFDALDAGKISLEDTVTVSEHAASMGGSQVFLEPGETQNVDTMIKCIAVASANDACVAMAEHIAGSEEEFVAKMNHRAKKLGMKNTTFVNCCGLDVDGHLTTAYDIALMSRELITKYPKIHDYLSLIHI